MLHEPVSSASLLESMVSFYSMQQVPKNQWQELVQNTAYSILGLVTGIITSL